MNKRDKSSKNRSNSKWAEADVVDRPSQELTKPRGKHRLPVPKPVFKTALRESSSSTGPVNQRVPSTANIERTANNESVSKTIDHNREHLPGSKILLVAGTLTLLLLTLSIFVWPPNKDPASVEGSRTAQVKAKLPQTIGLTNANQQSNGSARTNDGEALDRENVLSSPNGVEHETANASVDNQAFTQQRTLDELFLNDLLAEPATELAAKKAKLTNVKNDPAKEEKKILKDEVANANGPTVDFIPDAELDWKLLITFDPNGVMTIKVNEHQLAEDFSKHSAKIVFPDIAREVERRFSFLEPALGTRLKGLVSVDGTDFFFDDVTRLPEVMRLAVTEINQLKFLNPDKAAANKRRITFQWTQRIRGLVAEAKHLRSQIDSRGQSNNFQNARNGRKNLVSKLALVEEQLAKEGVNGMGIKLDSEFASLDLANQKVDLYYEGERRLTYEVVGQTEKMLQQMAADRIEWQKRALDDSLFGNRATRRLAQNKNTNEVSIDRKAFYRFAKTGRIVLPTPEVDFTIATNIQKMSPLQLKEQLFSKTASFDIFRDLKHFKSAEKYVIKENKALLSDVKQLSLKRRVLETKRVREKNHVNKRLQIEADIADINSQLHELKTEPLEPIKQLLAKRPDLRGLPLAMGEDCHMDSNSASAMNQVSDRVGRAISRFDNFGSRNIAQDSAWRHATIKSSIEKSIGFANREQTLKTINQIIQIDHPRLRQDLVQILHQEKSPTAMELLVKRAKYDFAPEIRDSATRALGEYPFEKFRDQLLDGLKYPWHVVAQHSAEALVRLDDQDAVPELVEMLKLPHPRLPVKVDENEYVQRELVGVNHMRNCMLCHAPSRSESDSGRSFVPSWNKPIPVSYYKGSITQGAFVRSDVIYLRQDFSVTQPVENHGPWPKEQRYDYLVQNKELSRSLAQVETRAIKGKPNLNREAIVYALKKLTGQQPIDDSYKTWLTISKRQTARRRTATNEGQNEPLGPDLRQINALTVADKK